MALSCSTWWKKSGDVVWTCSYDPWATTAPAFIRHTWSACGTCCSWWVVRITVLPFRYCLKHCSNTILPTWESTADSGSSSKYISAILYNARARFTRAFCPPIIIEVHRWHLNIVVAIICTCLKEWHLCLQPGYGHYVQMTLYLAVENTPQLLSNIEFCQNGLQTIYFVWLIQKISMASETSS